LSSFLLPAHGSRLKTKKPPKAQRKRHVSFRLLRHLPGHGLGRTRRRLALRSLSVRKPLRSFLSPLFAATGQRLLKAVFPAFSPRTSTINQQLKQKEKEEETSS